MQTSARNQFPGIVSTVHTGTVNDEVELTLASGHKLVATVTRDSRESLKLERGVQAIVLVKASAIVLVGDADGYKFSARNQISGRVAKVAPGAVNTEIELDAGGGVRIVAIITNHSAASLGLEVGANATALFKATQVIVAVAA